jgi:hypothetical protein
MSEPVEMILLLSTVGMTDHTLPQWPGSGMASAPVSAFQIRATSYPTTATRLPSALKRGTQDMGNGSGESAQISLPLSTSTIRPPTSCDGPVKIIANRLPSFVRSIPRVSRLPSW